MKIFGRPEAKKSWSPRSQRSVLAQWKLEDEREKCDQLILYSEKRVTELEASCKYSIGLAIRGEATADYILPTKRLAELEGLKLQLKSYQEHRSHVQSQIETLVNLSPSQVAERAECQTLLAKLATERLEKDRLMEQALQILLRLLQERRDLTSRMAAAASSIDLTMSPDGLDEARFNALQDSLPKELEAASEKWAASFLGERASAKPYVVRHKVLILPETLASANAYRAAERVDLTDEQAHDLLSNFHPDGVPVEGVRQQPIAELEATA